MADLTAPNGVKVQVADDRAERLLGYGFTAPKSEPKATKKAAAKPSKS